MSQKHAYTTADYLNWKSATALVRKLYRNGHYRMSLFIGCGIFFGLRVSDLLSLTWNQILNGEEFVIYEKKTDKRRVIRINAGFQAHAKDCFNALEIKDAEECCFLNRYGGIISLQMINTFIVDEIVEGNLLKNKYLYVYFSQPHFYGLTLRNREM